MGEGDTTRLVAWHHEMEAVHARLREALRVTREAIGEGRDVPAPERELLLFCHGFCVALDRHHRGEDDALFPGLAAQRPELAPVLGYLRQDHSMIAHLLQALRAALDAGEDPASLLRHLDGIGAIMETHFRYEERQLLPVLADLDLDLDPQAAFGPL